MGEPHEGFAPGTTWEQIPDDWFCPDCAVRDKADFILEGGDAELAAEGEAYAEVAK
ncbi:rubredoxin [Algiphilus sp.]|uniref:rubredoxin n=1 Tax=Algiphilus sp. TaxID=1872431 RepID=UPI0032ED3D6B